jgi:periplasmic divalent cation tolerance protein
VTEIRLLYVTTKDNEQARRIAESLLDRQLIACANILPHMESIYRWNGKVQNDSESVLILKTTAARVSDTIEAVKELHTYEIPCVLSLAIESGSQGYLDWLREQVL